MRIALSQRRRADNLVPAAYGLLTIGPASAWLRVRSRLLCWRRVMKRLCAGSPRPPRLARVGPPIATSASALCSSSMFISIICDGFGRPAVSQPFEYVVSGPSSSIPQNQSSGRFAATAAPPNAFADLRRHQQGSRRCRSAQGEQVCG
jgi:hypothetical protein